MIIKSNYFLEGIIVLVIIIFLQLFSYTDIPDNSKVLAAAVFGLGMLMALTSSATILFKKGFKIYGMDQLILVFYFSIFISFLTAYGYWEQPFVSSLLSYRLFYIFFLYFIFVCFDLSQQSVERIIIALFFLTLIVFVIDYLTFPNPLFSLRSEERRNGITIFFNGQGFTFLGAFYFLHRFLKKFKIINLVFFLIGVALLFFLTQSRMILLGIGLGSLLILFFSNLKNRYLWGFLVVAAAIAFYLFSSVFKGIKEENAAQAKFYSEDIRVQAQDFFLNDLQGGLPTLIFGNGYPAQGSKLEAITDYGQDMGYYTSDVGLTGILSFFGILGVTVWLFIFQKAFFMKDEKELTYVKAYLLAVFITAATGYSIFDPGYMPATVVALFLVRSNAKKLQLIKLN